MAALSSHIARTSLVYYATVAILSLRGIVLIPLLLRTFGPAQYGLYVLALSGISYGHVLALFGMDSSVYQYLTPVLRTKTARVVFWTTIQTVAAFASVLILGALVGGMLFLSGTVSHLVLACSVVAAGQVIWGLSLAPFRCEERSGIYMGSSMTTTLGDFVVTATTTLLARNLETVFVALACYHVAVAAVVLSIQSGRLPYHPWSFTQFRKQIRFGLNGLVNQLVITGYFVWDRTIVSVAAGLTAVAAYAPGMAMGAVILPLAGTSVFTLPTLLVRPDIRQSPTLRRSVLRQAIRQYALVAIPAAVGAALIARPFLRIITSPTLAAVAAPVAWLACGAVLASGLSRFAILALRADGEDKWLSKNLVLHFAVFVLLAAGLSFLWPRETPFFVAASILTVNLAQAYAAFRRLRRRVTNVLAPALFLTPAVGTAAFVWLHFLFPVQSLAAIVALVGVSIAVYAATTMALERVGPRKLIRFIRQPTGLEGGSADEPVRRDGERQTIILYSGPNHLFACAGIFYAAELAEQYEVHVILNEYGRAVITQPMLNALVGRNIGVHWLPDARGLKKHEAYHDFSHSLIEKFRPSAVFADDDMGVFDVVLARRARETGARVICFQTGTFGESMAYDYQMITRGQGALWARARGLPPEWGRRYITARQHAMHHWHYYLGPCLAGYRSYPGVSSIFLRRSHTGRRDGEFYLAYEPGSPPIAARDGTPEHKIIPIGHPLLRDAGKRLFSEIYPSPDFVEKNSALLLVDFPSEVASATSGNNKSARNWTSSLIEAVVALAKNLSNHYSQIIIKPHPALGRHVGFLNELKLALESVPGVRFVEPAINAIGFLRIVRIVIGDESTVLKLARYFPGLVIVSTDFSSVTGRRPFHASEAGFNVFDGWREAAVADLSALPATNSQCGCPEGADPAVTVVELLQRREILTHPQ